MEATAWDDARAAVVLVEELIHHRVLFVFSSLRVLARYSGGNTENHSCLRVRPSQRDHGSGIVYVWPGGGDCSSA